MLEKTKQIWEYDNMKLELIKSYGYNYEVIWEKELKNDINLIITLIKKYDKQFNFAP